MSCQWRRDGLIKYIIEYLHKSFSQLISRTEVQVIFESQFDLFWGMSIVKRILGQDKNRGDVVEGRKDSPRYRSLPKLLRKTHIISRLRTYLSGRTTSGNTHHICLDIPAIRAVPGCPSVGYQDLVFALRLRGVVDKVLLWPGRAMSCCLFHADCSVWPLDESEALLNSCCSLQ